MTVATVGNRAIAPSRQMAAIVASAKIMAFYKTGRWLSANLARAGGHKLSDQAFTRHGLRILARGTTFVP
jgi:hypothetical protein